MASACSTTPSHAIDGYVGECPTIPQVLAVLVNYDVAVPPVSSPSCLIRTTTLHLHFASTWLERARKVGNSRLQRSQDVLRTSLSETSACASHAAAHPLECQFGGVQHLNFFLSLCTAVSCDVVFFLFFQAYVLPRLLVAIRTVTVEGALRHDQLDTASSSERQFVRLAVTGRRRALRSTLSPSTRSSSCFRSAVVGRLLASTR